MPRRFYYERTTAPAVSPAVDPGWEQFPTVNRRLLRTTLANSFQASFTASKTIASADVGMIQFVSDALPAQTLQGTVKGQIMAYESSFALDATSQMVIKVVSNDGTTLRGVALDFDTSALVAADEWNPSTVRNVHMPRGGSRTLTPVAVQANDRIVVEIGFKSHEATTNSRSAGVQYYTDPAKGDLPEDQTTTTNDKNSWLEFSQDLLNPPAPPVELNGTVQQDATVSGTMQYPMVGELDGTVMAEATVGGTLILERRLSGTVQVEALIGGTLDLLIPTATHDDPADAIDVNDGYVGVWDVTAATLVDPGEPGAEWYLRASTWFTWTDTISQMVRVSTERPETNFNSHIRVYAGPATGVSDADFTQLVQVADSGDSAVPLGVWLSFLANPGQTYWIQVTSWVDPPAAPGKLVYGIGVTAEPMVLLYGDVVDELQVGAEFLDLIGLLELEGWIDADIALGTGVTVTTETGEVIVVDPIDNAVLTVPPPSAPDDGAPTVVKWRLWDGAVTYTFEINPARMVVPHEANVTAEATTGGYVLMTQGSFTPVQMMFSGAILQQVQYENLRAWLRKRRRIHLYDHLGRKAEVIVRSFAPSPRRAIEYPWRQEYQVTVLMLTPFVPA